LTAQVVSDCRRRDTEGHRSLAGICWDDFSAEIPSDLEIITTKDCSIMFPDRNSAFRAGFGPGLGPKSKINRLKTGPKLSGPSARTVWDRLLADLPYISGPKPVQKAELRPGSTIEQPDVSHVLTRFIFRLCNDGSAFSAGLWSDGYRKTQASGFRLG
jgi:hypothetical protein